MRSEKKGPPRGIRTLSDGVRDLVRRAKRIRDAAGDHGGDSGKRLANQLARSSHVVTKNPPVGRTAPGAVIGLNGRSRREMRDRW